MKNCEELCPRMLLTASVTVWVSETLLKVIKNYKHTSMPQDLICGFVILSIEKKLHQVSG